MFLNVCIPNTKDNQMHLFVINWCANVTNSDSSPGVRVAGCSDNNV